MDEDAIRSKNSQSGLKSHEIDAMIEELRSTRCIPAAEHVNAAISQLIEQYKNCFDSNTQQPLLTEKAMKTLQLQMNLIAEGYLSGM